MSLFTPRRIESAELLDEHDAPPDEMRRSLRDLRRFNRYAGGLRIYRKLVRSLVGEAAAPVVLDVGTGTSDLVQYLPRVAKRIGVDFKIDHLIYGRELGGPHVMRVVGDAWRLPFRDDSVDVVTSGHFFHHFAPDENVQLLSEAMRVARTGVAVNDTRRHIAPLAFVHAISALRLVGRITRFDAPASVRQGYTSREAGAVAARVTASRRKVLHLWPFRFGLLLWK